MDHISARYAPMNHSHILGFPNQMPCIDWQTYLPRFKDGKGDDVALHLIRFHMHVRKLRVQFHEDCLMKMFMATLEGKEKQWYENLPSASLYSLKDFHTTFFEKYKESYSSLLLVKHCCEHFENFIEHLENAYEDDEFMDEEILEAIYENPFQHQEHKLEHNCYEDEVDLQQTLSSPLKEDEVDYDSNDEGYVSSPEFDESSHKTTIN
jgi:hypothetical protein